MDADELRLLKDGTPPEYVNEEWDCATVIVMMAEELLTMREIKRPFRMSKHMDIAKKIYDEYKQSTGKKKRYFMSDKARKYGVNRATIWSVVRAEGAYEELDEVGAWELDEWAKESE